LRGYLSLMFIFYTNSEYARKFKNSDLSNSNSFISENVLNLSWVTANVTTRIWKTKYMNLKSLFYLWKDEQREIDFYYNCLEIVPKYLWIPYISLKFQPGYKIYFLTLFIQYTFCLNVCNCREICILISPFVSKFYWV